MSTSQFKAFMKCPAAIMAEINGEIKPENKDSYTEGHMFEAIVIGNDCLLYTADRNNGCREYIANVKRTISEGINLEERK